MGYVIVSDEIMNKVEARESSHASMIRRISRCVSALVCPKCGADLTGDPIDDLRSSYKCTSCDFKHTT